MKIKSKAQITAELQDHLSEGGTMNDSTTDNLYREWYNIPEDQETDLEKVEAWAVDRGSSPSPKLVSKRAVINLPPPASPLFRIGCYLPADEAHPVLVVIARNGLNLGPVHRKGELGYKALLEILETNPELFTPMYYQTAEALKALLS